jgi:hypothetical protein
MTITVASLLVPFLALHLYLVLLLRAGIYFPHADVASYGGLGLSLIVGLSLLWQLPLRRPWRIATVVLYLVCLAPLLILFNITTVCHVSGKCP